ncbi:50S ribosomal protein L7/L12 [Candidatus Roizmanbacteria bacterium CG_4_10_14_3_um_filter_39_13]|uniref:Large ribosomal subunit protein bL12 n=3 Tax=Candidatus Roizmaniibacteriota TaxID=1752723 RepID=A0A2M7LLM3_9BACT|nr:MAG: 50S ribosomal protein L7/L12 [Candidatus Roizmanbacteria bacterium CG07_land_8_20_14_0_80_34_15]PIV08142.1 MAG: 50S ribosomal protein L7/L12 [Candidatus Roizmanbacteria bacterium CG03_land_8_20_14_0_80_39_12]PIX68952.1 MAG: 50S ribosomal protein L7/L12 [Candidatus Roizmanbacteria bacterium CG_4_10_14_3_um_filter_39_13]
MAELNEKMQKIATELESLTVIEMAELAKYLEDKFGVTAIAAAAPAAAGAAAGPVEEKTSFTVVLTEAGANKLAVIKAVREVNPTLGLMDAKKAVETLPYELVKDAKKDVAEEAKKKVEAAGAKAEMK